MAVGSLPAIAYVLFIDKYATNAFYGDDWSRALLVHAAVHGHLSFGQLWMQYNETRLVLGNLVDVVIGEINGFDLRSVLFLSAAVFIAAYALLLALTRSYVGRPLAPVPLFVLGALWFSWADVQNALWAFQVSWYLTLLFLMVMIWALLMPSGHRPFWFGIAAVAAVAADLSTIQGFILWPVGVICICWNHPSRHEGRRPPQRTLRSLSEPVIWMAMFVGGSATYLLGYRFNDDGCIPSSACNFTWAVHHSFAAVRYFFALIGDVIPGGFVNESVGTLFRYELVGMALFGTAMFIVIQSWRYRTSREKLPLPLLLIAFAVLFDMMIAMSRSGLGPVGAIANNRYVMPNLVLTIGITIYAWAHLLPLLTQPHRYEWRFWVTRISLVVLAVFLVVQVVVSTEFGIDNGQATRDTINRSARFFANMDRVPSGPRRCEAYLLLVAQPGALNDIEPSFDAAVADRLGEFQPGPQHLYREQGLPTLFRACTTSSQR